MDFVYSQFGVFHWRYRKFTYFINAIFHKKLRKVSRCCFKRTTSNGKHSKQWHENFQFSFLFPCLSRSNRISHPDPAFISLRMRVHIFASLDLNEAKCLCDCDNFVNAKLKWVSGCVCVCVRVCASIQSLGTAREWESCRVIHILNKAYCHVIVWYAQSDMTTTIFENFEALSSTHSHPQNNGPLSYTPEIFVSYRVGKRWK